MKWLFLRHSQRVVIWYASSTMLLCGLKEPFDHINSCTKLWEIISSAKNKQTPHVIFQKKAVSWVKRAHFKCYIVVGFHCVILDRTEPQHWRLDQGLSVPGVGMQNKYKGLPLEILTGVLENKHPECHSDNLSCGCHTLHTSARKNTKRKQDIKILYKISPPPRHRGVCGRGGRNLRRVLG